MRYALISDIHANRPALDAVLNDIRGRPDVDAVYHLGDLVGYALWPNEVAALIASEGIPGVAGNYDSTIAMRYKHCGCRYENPRQEALSHDSYTWTLEHVTERTRAFLASLPFRIDIRPLGGHVSGPRLVLVHAHTTNNLIYVEHDRPDPFLSKMAQAAGLVPGDMIAFGHTHTLWHRVVDGIHFVNTGSVGRPKDGDPRAGYVLVTIGETAPGIEFVRVPYAIDVAATAILASDLPNEFAEFLQTGGQTPPLTHD